MSRPMSALLMTLGVLLGSAHLTLHAAPPATLGDHCRTFPTAGLFDRCVDGLMDSQFVVLSADKAAGVIAFRRVAQTGGYINHMVQVNGSLVIRPDGQTTSRIRLLIHQSWANTRNKEPMDAGVETDTDLAYYQNVFQAIQDAQTH